MRHYTKYLVISLLAFFLNACSSNSVIQPVSKHVVFSSAITQLPFVKTFNHVSENNIKKLPVYAQCQIKVGLQINPVTGLHMATEDTMKNVMICMAEAIKNKADVVILPELSLSYSVAVRNKLIKKLKMIANQQDMVIIAGSYYDSSRYSRVPIIGKGWIDFGYEMKPSFYEVSARGGLGMNAGKYLTVVKTKYGNIMPLICVDLISDGANFQIRQLAAENKIDVLANINYNPAAWEFLIEANSIVRRHPIFATVTNVSSILGLDKRCEKYGDNGSCGGNTALIANIRNDDLACPNCESILHSMLPKSFVNGAHKRLAYDNVVATIPTGKQGMLIYKLNLNLKRIPISANAPDQGYPPVKDLKFISLN